MNALLNFVVMSGLVLFIYIAVLTADIHHKSYKGHLPLYIIYSIISVIIYSTLVVFLISDLPKLLK